MWLRVGRFNLQKDAVLAQVLKIRQLQTFEWYLHELLIGRMPQLSAYQNIEFPPKLPDGYDEPIGVEFTLVMGQGTVRNGYNEGVGPAYGPARTKENRSKYSGSTLPHGT
jgi:hypothetical protein